MKRMYLTGIAVTLVLSLLGLPSLSRTTAEEAITLQAFDLTLVLPANVPVEVSEAIQTYGRLLVYEHYALTKDGERNTVVLVGMPWGPVRPSMLLFHEEGWVTKIYWGDSPEETKAWDPARGLRTLKPCPHGCLSTEICFSA